MNMNDNYPLKGIKVVELASAVAAPMAARIMASFGAEVIKVEGPPHGDILRGMAAGQMKRAATEENPVFDTINTGKKLAGINLKNEEGHALFMKLLSKADVFITNVRMKSLEGLGLDYDTLKEKYPGLIWAHLSGYGLQGPRVNAPGFDITAFWMLTGGATDSVEPDAHPVFPSFGFGDITSASNLLAGILMALIGRKQTGKGTLVSTSLFNTGMWSNSSYIIETQGPTAFVVPCSHYDTWDPFSFQYRCSDGKWIAIMEKHYVSDKPKFAKIFDLPELMTDPDMETLDKVNATGKGAVLVKKVEEIIATKTSDEWKIILDDNDVANAVAQHFVDIPKDPQARANGYLDDVEYYDGVNYSIPVPPMHFSDYKRKPFAKMAQVGADTDEVLKEIGITDEELQGFRERRVIV